MFIKLIEDDQMDFFQYKKMTTFDEKNVETEFYRAPMQEQERLAL